MQFSSRTPHEVVATPEDDALITTGDFRYEEVYGLVPEKFHNPTNSTLAAFREREDIHNIYARRQWRNFLRDGWDQSICRATSEEERHAGKVFERWDEVSRNHAIDDLLNLKDDA